MNGNAERLDQFGLETTFVLKQRHLELLQLLVGGLVSNQDVAKKLRGVSPNTVEQYRKEIFAELRRNKIYPYNINRGITEAVLSGLINVDFLPRSPDEPLDQREIEVLALEAQGYGSGDICEKLNINNLHRLYDVRWDILRKLGLTTIHQAVAWSAREMVRARTASNPHV